MPVTEMAPVVVTLLSETAPACATVKLTSGVVFPTAWPTVTDPPFASSTRL